jgi:hypothetical protein
MEESDIEGIRQKHANRIKRDFETVGILKDSLTKKLTLNGLDNMVKRIDDPSSKGGAE